jgi:hypothetical protein
MSSCGGGSGPLCVCFSGLSTVRALNYSQKQDYGYSWEMFRRVELYNSNVSTMHGNGDPSPSYWKFVDYEDASAYKTGGLLYYQYLGYSTIVQKN